MRLLSIGFFGLLLSCKSADLAVDAASTDPPVQVNPKGGYRVIRIDSLAKVYLIYVRKNNQTFKIVSDKEKESDCLSVRPGSYYNFDLRSLYFTDVKQNKEKSQVPIAVAGNLGSKGIDWDGKGTIITLEGDSITDIFYARNLVGLCIINK